MTAPLFSCIIGYVNHLHIFRDQSCFDFQDLPEKFPVQKFAEGLDSIERFRGYSQITVWQHSALMFYAVLAHYLKDKEPFKSKPPADFIVSVQDDLSLESVASYFNWEEGGVEKSLALIPKQILYAFLHDFHEMFTGDIPTTLKMHLKDLGDLEDEIDNVIFTYFGMRNITKHRKNQFVLALVADFMFMLNECKFMSYHNYIRILDFNSEKLRVLNESYIEQVRFFDHFFSNALAELYDSITCDFFFDVDGGKEVKFLNEVLEAVRVK